MKNINSKLFTVCLMLLCCICLFAEGTSEIFSSSTKEDTSTTTTNKIVQNYVDELNKYQEEYEKHSVEMQMAYSKSDANAYLEAKKALRDLEVPSLSQEDSDLALSQIIASNDIESAKLLYQYSRYYNPVLTLKANNDGFNYSSTLSVMPGSQVSLPELKTFNKAMIFKGWGLEEGVVKYSVGETIEMPIEDMTLYAVFEADPSVVQGASVVINCNENIEIKKNSKTEVDFSIKNNGTENLSNVEVLLESDDPLLYIFDEKLSSRYVESCSERVAHYTVLTKANVGTVLSATVTVKDSNNNIWTKDVTFTVVD